jgi:hypothetical protein
MANTTNFGWETPDDTDLVKDGAAAIRTLGSAIDASLADLEGGTTGQILSKTSNTDMDFTWITNDVGDITAVSAGTGISGGGTSGDITITNSMATAIDAKGDLVVGTGADTFSRLAVGTDTYVLTADSAEATGLKWAAASGGATFVGCQLEKITSAQSIPNGSATAVSFNSEVYDTDGFHDNSTNNSRITIPTGKGGKYLFVAQLSFAANGTGSRITKLFKNGSLLQLLNVSTNAGAADFAVNAASGFATASAGDYFEIYAEQYSGGNLNANYSSGNGVGCFFGAQFLGA